VGPGGSQVIQLGRGQHRVPLDPQAVAAPLAGQDEPEMAAPLGVVVGPGVGPGATITHRAARS
jgi:hypothetical protein